MGGLPSHLEHGSHYVLEISREQRDLAQGGELAWQREYESISCYRGIWDEGVGFSDSTKLDQMTKLERKNRCYFIPYQAGMLLPAAEKLQEKNYEQARELQKLRYTAYAILVSLLAIFVKLVLGSN
jgi:hypothetical protein